MRENEIHERGQMRGLAHATDVFNAVGGNEAEPTDLRPELQKFKQHLRARGKGAVETYLLNFALLSRFDALYKLIQLTAA